MVGEVVGLRGGDTVGKLVGLTVGERVSDAVGEVVGLVVGEQYSTPQLFVWLGIGRLEGFTGPPKLSTNNWICT